MKKILIIEDDLATQDVFKIIFENFGYEVECIDSGEKLFNKTSNWPDIIILDRQLPGVDGVQTCRYLKSQPQSQNIPVILITATAEIGEAAKTAGADDFFEKPFDMKSILKKVSGLLDKKESTPTV